MRTIRLVVWWLFALAFAPSVLAQLASQQSTKSQHVAPEAMLSNLNRPCAIAVRPGGTADRYELFIAESGAGRIVRWSTAASGEAPEIIAGFTSAADFDRFNPQGPVSLWFLDAGLLVVGTRGASPDALLRSYELPEDEKVLDADVDRRADARSADAGDSVCLALTRSRPNEFVADALLLAVRDGDGGTLLRARVQAGIVGHPKSFGEGEAASWPRALATSPAGRFVVGDQKGRLSFSNPIDGSRELHFTTKLTQLTGLAYSPTTGSLYAADFDQGLFRIDDASQPGRPACNPVKIAELKQLAALAFAPDGALYLITFGDGKNGTLQVITGDL